MKKQKRFSKEVRERAVRLFHESVKDHPSQWSAMKSIAEKVGCTPETMRRWVHRAEIDSGKRDGVSSEEKARIKELERENRELKRANEILRKASAYFAQAELDRPPKKW